MGEKADLDETKLQILSLGSISGMFIGSVVTFFFPKGSVVLGFTLLFLLGVWGVRQFYAQGKFSKHL